MWAPCYETVALIFTLCLTSTWKHKGLMSDFTSIHLILFTLESMAGKILDVDVVSFNFSLTQPKQPKKGSELTGCRSVSFNWQVASSPWHAMPEYITSWVSMMRGRTASTFLHHLCPQVPALTPCPNFPWSWTVTWAWEMTSAFSSLSCSLSECFTTTEEWNYNFHRSHAQITSRVKITWVIYSLIMNYESSPAMLVFTQTSPRAHSKQKGLRSYFSTEIGSMDPNTPGV